MKASNGVGHGCALVLGLATLGFWAPAADASPSSLREHVLPERNDNPAARAATWTHGAHWQTSNAVRDGVEGSRVAAAFSIPSGRSVTLQARGVHADASGQCAPQRDAGPWTPMEETFHGDALRVAVLDLEQPFACAQLRLASDDAAAVDTLQWELVEPRYPDAGRASREFVAPNDPLGAIPPELETIGVITREAWGARETQCSATEDDWYRMAIHHTAGPQTANGTVEEQLRGTQAYGMDSGNYCDIPYQMLVGYDGSLYEGRGLVLQSGATGGGNNPGNLAVCFIGCYHEPDEQCVGGVGHDPTDAMMQRGQLLVQTLVRLHDISTAEDNIRGHRDWPGNSTACPGSLLHPRLGEFRSDLTWFSGVETERSWTEGDIEVEVGTAVEIWVELENTGGLTWSPGQTFLAPTAPRDTASALYDASWPSEVRAATVEAAVEPGQVGRFTFAVAAASATTTTQSFGLVHEGVTWFADGPWGGGPTDDTITLTVAGVPAAAEGTSGGAGTSTSDGDETGIGVGTDGPSTDSDTAEGTTTDGTETDTALPSASEDNSGCGCVAPPTPSSWGSLLLLTLLGLRRRRR